MIRDSRRVKGVSVVLFNTGHEFFVKGDPSDFIDDADRWKDGAEA